VKEVIEQAGINLNRGLRFNELVRIGELLGQLSATHHHKEKTVHPLPPSTISPTPKPNQEQQTPPATNDSKTNSSTSSTDSPITQTKAADYHQKNAQLIVEHFLDVHTTDITRENLDLMTEEFFQKNNLSKGRIGYNQTLLTSVQNEIHQALETSPYFSNPDEKETATLHAQLKVNRKLAKLNTVLLSILFEEKGKELMNSKIMAQNIIGEIISKHKSETITYELLHDYIAKGSTTQGFKFEYNLKFPYYLSDALNDLLTNSSTSTDEKLSYRKRFTALNKLLTSSEVISKLQELGSLTTPPKLLNVKAATHHETNQSRTQSEDSPHDWQQAHTHHTTPLPPQLHPYASARPPPVYYYYYRA
jgi:hypothetical protein